MIKLEPGTICTFTYGTGFIEKPSKQGFVHDKFPQVLVLNSSWEGNVHGINLNMLSDKELNYLKAVVNPAFAREMVQKDPMLAQELDRLPKTLDVHSPHDFYIRFMKGFIQKYDSYRVYKPEKMINVRVVKKAEEFVGTEKGTFSDFVARTKQVRGKVPPKEYGRTDFDKDRSAFDKSYQDTMARVTGKKK